MATITDVVRDAPPKPIAPIDENVVIPERVRAAAAKAESFYRTEPTPEEKAAAEAEATRAEAARAAAEAQPEPAKEPATEPVRQRKKPVKAATSVEPEPAREPTAEPIAPDQWEHRYHSMKGRFDSATQTIGSMQEQMTQMGDELMRMQALVQDRRPAPPAAPRAPVAPAITDADKEVFGEDLINLARRAAQDALGPELDALKTENARLVQQRQQDAQMGVSQLLDRDIPNWREINRDPRFISWLRLRDIYSGAIRKDMLTAAFQAANAPRVKAFFDGFINDEAVTGNSELAPQPEPQAHVQPAPQQRQAAVQLGTLAAPGRAKPASGDTPGPADKPTFTRTQISKFYADVRRGYYAGRETEKNTLERQIFSAQNEGRVR